MFYLQMTGKNSVVLRMILGKPRLVAILHSKNALKETSNSKNDLAGNSLDPRNGQILVVHAHMSMFWHPEKWAHGRKTSASTAQHDAYQVQRQRVHNLHVIFMRSQNSGRSS